MVNTNPPDKDIELLSIYEKRGIETGLKQGIAIGEAIGMIRGKRSMLLRLFCLKFREITPDIAVEIECMNEAQLNNLALRILATHSLEEMGLK